MLKINTMNWIWGLALLFSFSASAQDDYGNYNALSTQIRNLNSRYPALTTLRSIGKSEGGKDIWLLTIGEGRPESKPAIVLAAGVNGSHLAGTTLSLQMAEKLLASASQDSIKRLLAFKTIYLFPLLNLDAREQAFANLRYERTGNARNTDDDRDGRLSEDGYDDLDGNKLITMMRVEDPTGTMMPHPDDPRILIAADPSKGEKGRFRVLTEGIDNDKDGEWNEDGEGGVDIDKNFSYDYPAFQSGAGEYPVSESENRALLDFLFDQKNVYAVFTFGPANNLSEPIKFDRMKISKRVITGLLEKDAGINDHVSKLYNRSTGLKNAPAMPATQGNFMQWAYFHYGRYSYSTPGWWAPKVEAPKDSTAKALKSPDNADLNFLRWAARENLNNVFVDWKAVNHPDFPGQKVEVGGFAPFVRLNPPVKYLDETAQLHARFFTAFMQQMPQLRIDQLKTEKLANGLTRISLRVYNEGAMPTHAEIGDRLSMHVYKVKTEVKSAIGQQIVSGRKYYLQASLAGGEAVEYTWLISGSGKLTIQASSPTAGTQSVEFNLN